jgi:glycosyltransferase involved in cell wall biosynthesis
VDHPTAPLPLVSICVINRNYARFLPTALASVLAQNYPNIQVVIVDDASTDESLAVIEAWQASIQGQVGVSVVASPVQQGVSATLNKAIATATGEYLAFLSSDDVLTPDSVSARMECLRNNPSKGAVFADANVIDATGQALHASALFFLNQCTWENLSTPKRITEAFIKRWAVPGPVLLVKRTLLNTIGLFDETLYFEDWDFYLRMAGHRQLVFLPQVVAGYRVHGANTSRSSADALKIQHTLMQTAFKNWRLLLWPHNVLLLQKGMVSGFKYLKRRALHYR